jgi:predicted metal-dependent hydrolase
MPKFHDDEFGDVTVRRSSLGSSVKLSISPSGTLRISMPKYAPLFMAKRLIASSRPKIRALKEEQQPVISYHDGMQIGKSHHLQILTGSQLRVDTHGQTILLHLPSTYTTSDTAVQEKLRGAIIKALRKEAKSYLPKRLSYLAEQHGFSYQSVRFSHASSRWGSCSSNKTISLNIALMKLDFNLIDYVLIHELAHTVQMNHSDAFWAIVHSIDTNYKVNRKLLKMQTPSV